MPRMTRDPAESPSGGLPKRWASREPGWFHSQPGAPAPAGERIKNVCPFVLAGGVVMVLYRAGAARGTSRNPSRHSTPPLDADCDPGPVLRRRLSRAMRRFCGERFENVRDHLFVKQPDRVQNRTIVVLDDVVTSGASLMYARQYLLDAGADSVSCVAIAKAIGNQ